MVKEIKMVALLSEAERDNLEGLVKRAISFYRSAGKDIALAEFMNSSGQFVRGDHYIFAMDLNGVMLAHPINERFVGLNFLNFRDSDGRSFIREIVENATHKGSGFAEYRWYHPASEDELLKTIYYEKIDSTIICGGFYRSKEHDSESCFEPGGDYPANFFELLNYLGV